MNCSLRRWRKGAQFRCQSWQCEPAEEQVAGPGPIQNRSMTVMPVSLKVPRLTKAAGASVREIRLVTKRPG